MNPAERLSKVLSILLDYPELNAYQKLSILYLVRHDAVILFGHFACVTSISEYSLRTAICDLESIGLVKLTRIDKKCKPNSAIEWCGDDALVAAQAEHRQATQNQKIDPPALSVQIQQPNPKRGGGDICISDDPDPTPSPSVYPKRAYLTPDSRMSFGLHKGTHLDKVPPDYMEWCLQNLPLNPSEQFMFKDSLSRTYREIGAFCEEHLKTLHGNPESKKNIIPFTLYQK